MGLPQSRSLPRVPVAPVYEDSVNSSRYLGAYVCASLAADLCLVDEGAMVAQDFLSRGKVHDVWLTATREGKRTFLTRSSATRWSRLPVMYLGRWAFSVSSASSATASFRRGSATQSTSVSSI